MRWQRRKAAVFISGDDKMKDIQIIKKNIIDFTGDAIVNAANEYLLAGGGVCGAIFRAAGYVELQKACLEIGHCDTGAAVITSGFNLKVSYIIHTVGPIWDGGDSKERDELYKCYQSSLDLARENDIHKIAFPLISSGIYGVPIDIAWDVAIQSVMDYQLRNDDYRLDIIFAVLDEDVMKSGIDILRKQYYRWHNDM